MTLLRSLDSTYWSSASASRESALQAGPEEGSDSQALRNAAQCRRYRLPNTPPCCAVLQVYADVADVEAYRRLGVTYPDLCCPQMLDNDPDLFFGFWGMCVNEYRDTTPHAGFDILLQWKQFVMERSREYPTKKAIFEHFQQQLSLAGTSLQRFSRYVSLWSSADLLFGFLGDVHERPQRDSPHGIQNTAEAEANCSGTLQAGYRGKKAFSDATYP